MCRSRTKHFAAHLARPLTIAITLGTMLGGCSEMYFDRRDPVALGTGDAIAANEAMQTIDPWPASSGNTNIPGNGQRMQAAAERYRSDKVTPPVDPIAPVAAAQANSQGQAAPAGGSLNTTTTTTSVTTSAPSSTAAQ